MIWHRCDLKLPSLFGPACCGREVNTYDRARKAWLCPEHTKERLCEFCQFERAWVRCCYTEKKVTCEIWLCVECAGIKRCRKAAMTSSVLLGTWLSRQMLRDCRNTRLS